MGGYIGFKKPEIEGQGAEVGLYIGGEYKLNTSIGIAGEFGPTIIDLKSGSVQQTGVEWVVNTAVYFYLF